MQLRVQGKNLNTQMKINKSQDDGGDYGLLNNKHQLAFSGNVNKAVGLCLECFVCHLDSSVVLLYRSLVLL